MQCRNDCFRTISPRKHGWCLRLDLWPTRSKVSIENVLCLVSGDISQILCPAQLLIGWLNCLMRTVLKYKACPTSHLEEAPPLFSTLWARAPSQGWAVAISTHMWCAAINTGPGGTIRAAYPSITFFALHQILYSTVSTKAHVCFTNTWDTLTRKHRFQFPHHHFKFRDILKTSFKSSFGNFLRTSPQNSLARFLLQLLRSVLLPSFTARKNTCPTRHQHVSPEAEGFSIWSVSLFCPDRTRYLQSQNVRPDNAIRVCPKDFISLIQSTRTWNVVHQLIKNVTLHPPALQQHRQQYNMLKNTDPNIDKRLVSTLTFATSPQRNKSYIYLIYTSITISVPLSKKWPSPLPLFLDCFGSTSFRFVLQKVQDLVHNSDSNPLSIFHRTATTWTWWRLLQPSLPQSLIHQKKNTNALKEWP